jgi:Uma2 family endonuclease
VSTTTGLMTVEAFLQLPDPAEGRIELHHGEVIHLPPVKRLHTELQKRLEKLLEAVTADRATVYVELPFRPASEYELWVADVGLLTRERVEAAAAAGLDYYAGAPDLVVEVLSPPQTAEDLFDKERICLSNGCGAFWIVDPKNRQIKVSTPDGTTTTYRAGNSVPVLVLPGSIDVYAVFRQ